MHAWTWEGFEVKGMGLQKNRNIMSGKDRGWETRKRRVAEGYPGTGEGGTARGAY